MREYTTRGNTAGAVGRRIYFFSFLFPPSGRGKARRQFRAPTRGKKFARPDARAVSRELRALPIRRPEAIGGAAARAVAAGPCQALIRAAGDNAENMCARDGRHGGADWIGLLTFLTVSKDGTGRGFKTTRTRSRKQT